ncbi:MAG: type II toxin-antitoxin system RelE/ParE family toxin [Firmicutes bacterium]|nr:type II toxin-antitoxin system RelE/ParE family toxin [Bacillota bacterium]
MAVRIRWSPKAVKGLQEICNFIEQNSEFYAILFAKRVFNSISNLKEFPLSGRIVPEYHNPNLREKIFDNYRIVYRIKEDVLEIVAICHGSRLLRL